MSSEPRVPPLQVTDVSFSAKTEVPLTDEVEVHLSVKEEIHQDITTTCNDLMIDIEGTQVTTPNGKSYIEGMGSNILGISKTYIKKCKSPRLGKKTILGGVGQEFRNMIFAGLCLWV